MGSFILMGLNIENSTTFPNIITCPSELVALSAALGYAQVTGIPVGSSILFTVPSF
jgi:hypothetical protein